MRQSFEEFAFGEFFRTEKFSIFEKEAVCYKCTPLFSLNRPSNSYPHHLEIIPICFVNSATLSAFAASFNHARSVSVSR